MDDTHASGRERLIAGLIESTACTPEQVPSVFAQEFARLEAKAKIRTHLAVLTASRVRAILRGHSKQDRAA